MIGLSIWSDISFSYTDSVKYLIMYAVLFLLDIQQVSIIKIFAWQIIHRSSIKIDIKKIGLMVARTQSNNNSHND